ncbi:helix-turn-helix transcriptional regulator [Pararhodobacter zhoushanensis]|uniref:helix-turn-helix transcriptional regulator n=1 Tax=Pararhodobacter zhoushanensis TaxID=2479545 RepID=UPI001C6FE8E8|nr:YafY family protein [Pararhodobacter zhoushanensis]
MPLVIAPRLRDPARMTTRSERLLAVLQILRRHRRPLAATRIAEETGTSLRTVYRDIDALRAQGAVIEGEAGVGYVLRPGFLLPPLMFSRDELEALVLGARLVAGRGDPALAGAAGEALARIGAVLPEDLRLFVDTSPLLVPRAPSVSAPFMPALRGAIRDERKAEILYRDKTNAESQRVIWPFAMGFFDTTQVIVAWCELRQSVRHFRNDRIAACTVTDQRYPVRRLRLLRDWRDAEKVRLAGDADMV